MNTHTKGPWHVEYELDENREKTDVIFVAHVETECDMTAIAHLYNILGTDEENKANAYLIAAAPEMLEALKMFDALNSSDNYYHWDELSEKVTAILQKLNVRSETDGT